MSLEQAIQANTKAIEQLIAVLSATNIKPATVAAPVTETAPVKEAPAKKQEAVAATEAAATQPTAETSAAPEEKATQSEVKLLSADEIASAITAAVNKVGKPKVIELLASYGAKRATEVAAEKRAEFDAKLLALGA